MKCKFPYKEIEGLGCLSVYYKYTHSYVEALAECQKREGDIFEFTNFGQQQQKFYNYLVQNGGKATLLHTSHFG